MYAKIMRASYTDVTFKLIFFYRHTCLKLMVLNFAVYMPVYNFLEEYIYYIILYTQI